MPPLAASAPYPPARRGPDGDQVAGTYVADPFRWLEDADDAQTRAFVAAQNSLTRSVLDAIAVRAEIRSQLERRWTYPRAGVPFSHGGRWFQLRNSGRENQPVLWTMDDADGEGAVLLDPNAFSTDGTVAVTGLSVSPDGELVAYSTAAAGSDWQTWRVRSVTAREDLTDTLAWSKFSEASWLPDSGGFFYGAPDRPAEGAELSGEVRGKRLLLHRLGTPQSDDQVVFDPGDPDLLVDTDTTPDGRYLVIYVRRGTDPANRLYVIDLRTEDLVPVAVVEELTWTLLVVASDDRSLWVLTDHGADRRRVLAADRRIDGSYAPIGGWREVVAEGSGLLLSAAHRGGSLVCHYLEDAHSALRVVGLDGSARGEIAVPGVVTVADAFDVGREVGGHPDEPVVYFRTTSFVNSGTLWRHDLESGETTVVVDSRADVDDEDVTTDLVFATSSDGTRVPMFVTHRRDVTPGGDAPVWLYGYGGFTVTITPEYKVPIAVWLERGGVYASAVLRGGGEFGTAWHDAGRLANKQNVFDDFAACARHLVEAGWTRPERIAINGASNGGLLVGACLNQHPELYGAAIAQVGVMDMLRFHRFTIGWAWTADYGDPEDPTAFAWLRTYSPLHNVRTDVSYPPVLVMTGDHDDRVVPGHSLKYAAALQEAVWEAGRGGPVLLRIATSAGHGVGMPVDMRIDEAADMLAFMEAALG
jgi:prolyl oligopeptidase